jgi:transposase
MSDIVGGSGRAILTALIAGETDPSRLADLTRGRLKATRAGLLTTMPGRSETTARVLIAEIGTDMTRFSMVGHLISWAGLCPRLHESAGKRRSTRTRQSASWLKPTLVNAAWAATRKNDSYLRAQFLRIKSRLGEKAILAVARSC